jgi:DNA-directed RNA polymerase specialized sigma24 family protein
MTEQEPPPCTQLLRELFAEPEFQRIVDLVSREVARSWSIDGKTARDFVMSALGEPDVLRRIHTAWFVARQLGTSLGLAKVIIRRRVIDLLRRDARPSSHGTLAVADDAGLEAAFEAPHQVRPVDPRLRLQLLELAHRLRCAIDCFATQGKTQQRQAQLLRRYALDEASYADLSIELACSENALRVRVHKAMRAFRNHVDECHAELENLLGA